MQTLVGMRLRFGVLRTWLEGRRRQWIYEIHHELGTSPRSPLMRCALPLSFVAFITGRDNMYGCEWAGVMVNGWWTRQENQDCVSGSERGDVSRRERGWVAGHVEWRS